MAKKEKKQPVTKKTVYVAIERNNIDSLGGEAGIVYDNLEHALINAAEDLGVGVDDEIVIAKVTIEDPIAYKVESRPVRVSEIDFSNV